MRKTMRHFSRILMATLGACTLLSSVSANASDYTIDPTHSFVEFRIKHLGYSWLYGRFNTISGTFSHDPANPDANSISVEVDTASIDSNHQKRDDHIRSADFLEVEKHPTATFMSTKYTGDENAGQLTGDLTVNGVTKEVTIEMSKIGEGDDPWGGYRAGFEGSLTMSRADFGLDQTDLGPSSVMLEMTLGVEGTRN